MRVLWGAVGIEQDDSMPGRPPETDVQAEGYPQHRSQLVRQLGTLGGISRITSPVCDHAALGPPWSQALQLIGRYQQEGRVGARRPLRNADGNRNGFLSVACFHQAPAQPFTRNSMRSKRRPLKTH